VGCTCTSQAIDFFTKKDCAQQVKALVQSIEKNDKVCMGVLKELQEGMKEVRAVYGKNTKMDDLKSFKDAAMFTKAVGWNFSYGTYGAAARAIEVKKTFNIARLLNTDQLMAREGVDTMAALKLAVANETAYPGIKVLGCTIIKQASRAAMILKSGMGIVSGAFGIYDIVEGLKMAKNGPEEAKMYHKVADDFLAQADCLEEMYTHFKKMNMADVENLSREEAEKLLKEFEKSL